MQWQLRRSPALTARFKVNFKPKIYLTDFLKARFGAENTSKRAFPGGKILTSALIYLGSINRAGYGGKLRMSRMHHFRKRLRRHAPVSRDNQAPPQHNLLAGWNNGPWEPLQAAEFAGFPAASAEVRAGFRPLRKSI
jgi:hypothetical protein